MSTTYVCLSCGEIRHSLSVPCQNCAYTPATEDDLVDSILASTDFLSSEQLTHISTQVRNGTQIRFPQEVRDAAKRALQSARDQYQPQRLLTSRKIIAGIAIALGLVILWLWHGAWPNYQYAQWADTVPSYETFLDEHGTSEYGAAARERLRILREDDVWSEAVEKDDLAEYRKYLRVYDDGKYRDEAYRRINKISEIRWASLRHSRSVADLREFLSKFPESDRASDAAGRIEVLYRDLEWVKEQDSIDIYKRFLEIFPNHRERGWIEGRIVDLEVDAIASGEHGELPPVDPVAPRVGATHAVVRIQNATGHQLVVRYSGSKSTKMLIEEGGNSRIRLPVGEYRVAASVDTAGVSNYYGVDQLKGGAYEIRFYIETSYSPTFRRRRR